ncbi:MAG: trigger factor, trigger factor [candidate division WS6 bacterium GW2011_GWC1_33_20]|uniref:Trigger factor n=2 Tax=Candidatus Dojkabacteria TaxID=74243 RepID=A0A0G0DHE1_9BACT|nr:MAG: trigger factor, trigger factor [candidate division WS6 bacterium GW2011_GWF1_33_233]KKP44423.1 MAG: trigger factor, trigger factor [candidate division WS6 bacterium GW2011_GWC1_33_20]KKP53283.1 MAG: trigger factor, trigger factor [candidate division WS6 bacterium GW2011_WS6_33_547]KKP54757.1 MAG: Trigger factor [candidate division WS6 bacterium GW2011_GWB1_33_6]KKP55934.1 MAG: Trigger factor [candidate division WS6 bacterium GW2011_GWF2_33_92]KKP81695.1 MAG: Trigger factor [candidate d
MDDFYTKKDINEYTFELTIKIPHDSFKKSYDLLLKDYSKDSDMQGFRKGKVPTSLISDQVKEMVKFETFEKLAPMYINTAITKEKLEPIAPPEYKEIPKILEDIDVIFTITITTMPKFKLGNMKNVKVKKEDITVDDKEVEEAIEELKKTQKTKETEVNDKWAVEIAKVINAEEVKTVKELREKIKDALHQQKEHYQMHHLQDEALFLGIKESNIEIPQPAINFEATEREKSFNEDMKGRGIKIEDFLKANNITIEKMRELWLQDAKEALQADTFLGIYADSKKVEISEEELNKKIEDIKRDQPNVDKNIFSNTEWIEYIKKVERKEKAFRLFIEEVLGKEFLDSHN